MPIEMLDLDAAREEIASGAKLIDVREQNEWDESHIDAALHVPQGEFVERIDEIAPDTSERLLLHCRTDNRSARGRRAQRALGYENVAVVERRDRRLGGRRAADRQRLQGITPRAADALLAPHAAARGRRRGPAQAARTSKVLLLGAGGLGAPPRSTWPRPASARSASSTTTWSTSRTSSAR